MLRKTQKSVVVGDYLAKVSVEVDEDTGGWGPTMSGDDVRKLQEVRRLLSVGDMQAASKLAEVFELKPVRVA